MTDLGKGAPTRKHLKFDQKHAKIHWIVFFERSFFIFIDIVVIKEIKLSTKLTFIHTLLLCHQHIYKKTHFIYKLSQSFNILIYQN